MSGRLPLAVPKVWHGDTPREWCALWVESSWLFLSSSAVTHSLYGWEIEECQSGC